MAASGISTSIAWAFRSTQSLPVDCACLQQLPCSLAPTGATGLQSERGQNPHWHAMHQQVFALETETLPLGPTVHRSEGSE
jgi:hypothetical protein